MKYLLLLIFICSFIIGQEKNYYTYFDDKTEKDCIIGVCDRTAFADSNYSVWFDTEYDEYVVDVEFIKPIEDKLNECEITIVLATWCSDSRREVPRLFKILDVINYPTSKLTIIAVNREKNGVEKETEGLNINLVPTFIVYKDKNEIGRIIETPVQSLEKDLASIFNPSVEE